MPPIIINSPKLQEVYDREAPPSTEVPVLWLLEVVEEAVAQGDLEKSLGKHLGFSVYRRPRSMNDDPIYVPSASVASGNLLLSYHVAVGAYDSKSGETGLTFIRDLTYPLHPEIRKFCWANYPDLMESFTLQKLGVSEEKHPATKFSGAQGRIWSYQVMDGDEVLVEYRCLERDVPMPSFLFGMARDF